MPTSLSSLLALTPLLLPLRPNSGASLVTTTVATLPLRDSNTLRTHGEPTEDGWPNTTWRTRTRNCTVRCSKQVRQRGRVSTRERTHEVESTRSHLSLALASAHLPAAKPYDTQVWRRSLLLQHPCVLAYTAGGASAQQRAHALYFLQADSNGAATTRRMVQDNFRQQAASHHATTQQVRSATARSHAPPLSWQLEC